MNNCPKCADDVACLKCDPEQYVDSLWSQIIQLEREVKELTAQLKELTNVRK